MAIDTKALEATAAERAGSLKPVSQPLTLESLHARLTSLEAGSTHDLKHYEIEARLASLESHPAIVGDPDSVPEQSNG